MRHLKLIGLLLGGLLVLTGMIWQGQTAALSLRTVAVSQSKQAACAGLSQISGTTKADCSNLSDVGGGVGSIVATVVTILSWVVGVAAVIMIIVSGVKFITSGGDSGKVSSAKTTLAYALIGVAVAALAQFLVHFVLHQASS